MAFLQETAVFLTAAVIAVPIAKRLGLGAVLGYLAAGAAIGPQGLGLVSDVLDIFHFAEFGVVLLLFLIGLELQPSRLWTMRQSVFGLGCMQLFVTGGALALAGRLLGLGPQAAAVVGLALSLSSTAFALQILAEKNQLTTRHGRAAFSILLLQDLAVIPLLALVPLLAPGAQGPMRSAGALAVVEVLGILITTAVAGRFFLRYALRVVATTRVHEVFTAFALLTVVGTTVLMERLGLSPALGAFLAGVLLADSEYRHELQADVEPFKGLLLGLFFIAVGMSLNMRTIVGDPGAIALLVAGLIMIKGVILYALGRANGLGPPSARALAVAVAQGGEFAFVVLGVAVEAQVITRDLSDQLIAAVTLSLVATPLLFAINGAIERREAKRKVSETAYDALPGDESQVIIAGFGRFGQIVARILRAKRIPFTALDISSEQVNFVRNYGSKVYYGDASRLDLLLAARADRAIAFVLAIDDVAASVRTAEVVRRHFPHLKIYGRARNRQHAYRLMELGISVVWRETFLSSLDMARELLKGLGLPDFAAARATEIFREHDERRLYSLYGEHRNEERMRMLAKKAAEELEELFAQDAANEHRG
jgi:glutathione-regulated potassium-efflux system ancillary protein KefC/glutathione-regulated potassium-efflux system protein KefB